MNKETIYREDAIKAIWGEDINPSEDGMVFEAQSHIDRDIRLIPSADRPQGEWYQIKDHKVMGEGYMWHCSLCAHRVYQDSSADYPTENFCPNCGARMKGADDE